MGQTISIERAFESVREGRLYDLQVLIVEGVPPNAADGLRNTLLHNAVLFEQVHIVDYLLSVGAPVNVTSMNSETPLHVAAHTGNQLITEKLLQAGAQINVQNINGFTPLHIAAGAGINQDGHRLVVQMLLDFDHESENVDGYVPIATVRDADGKTAEDWALEKSYHGIAELVSP